MTESNRKPWDIHERSSQWKRGWNRHYKGKSFVYFIFDLATDELLYIGSTGNLPHRSAHHHHVGIYRREAVRYEYEGPFDTRLAAYVREAECIATIPTRDNKRAA